MNNEVIHVTHPQNPPETTAAKTEYPIHNRPELYEVLRKYRRELANAKRVPPYIICTNKSLHDMCAKLPRNDEDLKTVVGLGQRRLENYGKLFLEIIARELSDARPLV